MLRNDDGEDAVANDAADLSDLAAVGPFFCAGAEPSGSDGVVLDARREETSSGALFSQFGEGRPSASPSGPVSAVSWTRRVLSVRRSLTRVRHYHCEVQAQCTTGNPHQ